MCVGNKYALTTQPSSSSKLHLTKTSTGMSTAEIRVLREIQVSPLPSSAPTQASQPISFLDMNWLFVPQVERLFLYDYPHPTSDFMDNHLHTFISSLSFTLCHFYPLAGAIRRSPASDEQFEIIYTEGDSVTVTIAEYTGENFRHISGHHPRNFDKLRLLVPRLPELLTDRQSPLVSLQVTLFPNQGLCIAFVVNHATCDGSGSMQFIRTWAAACRSPEGTFNIAAPLLDRSVIVDEHGLSGKVLEKMQRFHETLVESLKDLPTVISPSHSLVAATFTLSKEQIGRLKKKVQAMAVEEGMPLLHISAFVVTCAYVLRCIAKAKRYEDDLNIYFMCAVDWRQRMRPPVPKNYFGNCLGTSLAEAVKAGRIAGKDGVEVAAIAVGRSIEELQGKQICDVIIESIDKLTEILKMKSVPISVAGSPKLGVYETDFGWGRPVKVEVTSVAETGAIAVAESREEGGLEVGLVLPEEEMKEFKTNFENGLGDIL